MTTHTHGTTPAETVSPEIQMMLPDTKVRSGPVARILAKISKISKISTEYAEYQLENCSSRRMVL